MTNNINKPSKKLIIALLAGEVSGDQLGADLMTSILEKNKNVHFVGIGGENMTALGFENLMDIKHLSVMGFDALKQLFLLLKLRKKIIQQLLNIQPDVVIGIDAPDFNLVIERKMKEKGIRTYHWVSPSVWAWRTNRVKKIGKSCDEVFCLFPEEPKIYQQYKIKASYYGHPMADKIPLRINQSESFKQLKKNYKKIKNWKENCIIALLPGSRVGEIEKMTPLFFQVAEKLLAQYKNLKFILPIAKSELKDRILSHQATLSLPLKNSLQVVEGNAQKVIVSSDFVLLASGTAVLETMLLKRNMLIAHQSSFLNCLLLKLFLKTPFVSLANFLSGRMIVTELLCGDATVHNIYKKMEELINKDTKELQETIKIFDTIHKKLAVNGSSLIAKKVITDD